MFFEPGYERVEQSVDCWIIALCPENQLPAVWRNFVVDYRGVIFFGKFWDKDGEDLKRRFGYDGKPLLLVYPWTREKKKMKPQTTDDIGKALEIVIESMPVKNLNQITFLSSPDDPTNMDQFLLRSFYGENLKPKFPVVFVYDDEKMGGVPAIFRVLGHYFKDYFQFGLVNAKNVDQMVEQFTSYPKPKNSELPQLVTLVGKEPTDEEFDEGQDSLSFQLIVMSKLKFGEFNFNNIVAYLFWINDNFRNILPGKSEKETLDEQTLKETRNKLWWRIENIKPAQVKKEKVASNLDKKAADALKKFNEIKAQAQKLQDDNFEKMKNLEKNINEKQKPKKEEL